MSGLAPTLRSIRAMLLLVLAGALCHAPATALAQPAEAAPADEARRNQARSLADNGYAMFEQGRYDEALAHFQAAEKIFHAATLVLMIAQTQAKRGRLADALEAYQRVADEQLPPDAPPAYQQAQQEARQELAALGPRVPRLQLGLRDRRDIDRVALSIDGQAMEPIRLAGPIAVNPGRHTIEVTVVGGAPTVRTIDFSEGQLERIELDLPASLPKQQPADARHDASAAEPGSLAPAVSLFAVAGAGLLVGIIAGAVALDKDAELADLCPDKSCYVEDQQTVEELSDSATTSATVSTVGFVVAGLGTAAGVTWLLLRDSADSPATAASLALQIQPASAWLRGSF